MTVELTFKDGRTANYSVDYGDPHNYIEASIYKSRKEERDDAHYVISGRVI